MTSPRRDGGFDSARLKDPTVLTLNFFRWHSVRTITFSGSFSRLILTGSRDSSHYQSKRQHKHRDALTTRNSKILKTGRILTTDQRSRLEPCRDNADGHGYLKKRQIKTVYPQMTQMPQILKTVRFQKSCIFSRSRGVFGR